MPSLYGFLSLLVPGEFNRELSLACFYDDLACDELVDSFLFQLRLTDTEQLIGVVGLIRSRIQSVSAQNNDSFYIMEQIYEAHRRFDDWPFWYNMANEMYPLSENIRHLLNLDVYMQILANDLPPICKEFRFIRKIIIHPLFDRLCLDPTVAHFILIFPEKQLIDAEALYVTFKTYYPRDVMQLRYELAGIPFIFNPVKLWNCRTVYLDKHCLDVTRELSFYSDNAINRLFELKYQIVSVHQSEELFKKLTCIDRENSSQNLTGLYTSQRHSEEMFETLDKDTVMEYQKTVKLFPFFFAARHVFNVKGTIFVWPFWNQVLETTPENTQNSCSSSSIDRSSSNDRSSSDRSSSMSVVDAVVEEFMNVIRVPVMSKLIRILKYVCSENELFNLSICRIDSPNTLFNLVQICKQDIPQLVGNKLSMNKKKDMLFQIIADTYKP